MPPGSADQGQPSERRVGRRRHGSVDRERGERRKRRLGDVTSDVGQLDMNGEVALSVEVRRAEEVREAEENVVAAQPGEGGGRRVRERHHGHAGQSLTGLERQLDPRPVGGRSDAGEGRTGGRAEAESHGRIEDLRRREVKAHFAEGRAIDRRAKLVACADLHGPTRLGFRPRRGIAEAPRRAVSSRRFHAQNLIACPQDDLRLQQRLAGKLEARDDRATRAHGGWIDPGLAQAQRCVGRTERQAAAGHGMAAEALRTVGVTGTCERDVCADLRSSDAGTQGKKRKSPPACHSFIIASRAAGIDPTRTGLAQARGS